MDYVVDLDSFHGPLDLLLFLIDENQIDIYDIPIARITDQYMEYLNITGDFDLEKLGDFLIMASYLLSLKIQMLLPRQPDGEEEETEEQDPRVELVQRLLYYRKFKIAAEKLEGLKNGETKRYFHREDADFISAPSELTANINILAELLYNLLTKAKEVQLFEIPRDDIDVSGKMAEILVALRKHRQGVFFKEFINGIISKRELAAFFLALLELIRLQKIKAVQENDFDSIKIFLGGRHKNVNEG
ncbi:MAG TPA: segregation/condensation protein A [Syntrophomonadaceae bacterium]|nr:segregation/condensation protein A [Syntrophomonadaceae bacterium]HNX28598.1 segregation/condensation protein A [Syntrophomonadaceae bacterium]HPR93996.1 segregation/condensation protein A [Syntrophomonadaceae bacterium]